MESLSRMLAIRCPHLGVAGFVLAFCLCASHGMAWEINGSLKDDAGNPIQGVWISGHGDAGETNFASVQVMTEADGSFLLEAFDGSWRLSVDQGEVNSR